MWLAQNVMNRARSYCRHLNFKESLEMMKERLLICFVIEANFVFEFEGGKQILIFLI